MVDWFELNKEWLFSGLGATILGGILAFFFKGKGDSVSQKSQNFNDQSNTINIQNIVGEQVGAVIKKFDKSIPRAKAEVKIMFVDDDTTFKIIDILKDAGWVNTSIVSDIRDTESMDVRNTHMFFIDQRGVALWLSKRDQGLALAEKIKDKYPEKVVVMYSSDSKGDRAHSALQKIDWFLPKHAEPVDFINVIERFITDK